MSRSLLKMTFTRFIHENVNLNDLLMKIFSEELKRHSGVCRYAPTERLGVKVSGMSVIDDDQIVVLLLETLQRRFWRSGHVTPETGAFARPAEAVTLSVVFGKH